MALQNAPRVGIHNKDRVVSCVEQDGIRGFRTDAVNTQELLSQLCSGSAEHCRKGAAMFFSEKLQECFKLPRLLPEVARRADEAGELRLRNFFNSGGRKQVRLAQIGDGARGVYPSGVLNQDGADDYFEGRSPRPPVLFPVRLKEGVEVLPQYGQALQRRRRLHLRAAAWLADRRFNAGESGQSGTRTHLFCTISTHCRQVKNATLSFLSAPCSTGQVLANSQRWVKIGHRKHRLFAMFGDRCTSSRERCGCLSV
jgi:hypothetical protein